MFVKLFEHELELFAVLGRVVCFASDEGVLAVADVVYLLCTELGHLCCAASGKYFLCHVRAWILRCGSSGRLRQVGEEGLIGIAVDAQQDAIAAKANEWSNGLALELDAVGLGWVGLAEGLKRDTLQAPLDTLLRWNVLQAQIAVGILVEVTWPGGCLLAGDCHAECCAWQVIGDTFEGASWYEGLNFRLSKGNVK